MSKAYINYYTEIRHLPVDEQEKILQQARYEAFSTLQLNGISAAYFFGSLALFFTPVALALTFSGPLSLPTILASGISIVGAMLLNRYLQGKLIRKGLNRVLSGTSV
ncbi:hypothetical protein [Alteromonas gilva]|uniref:Uncharacterized protein n=1 Tax=Alteromonas gilva TaxID=2987522 RepID=A0ABT5L0P4_9ALTE|nr:hypothetical protein [Alteromonas gilva]MDC8830613.1 hypothetical protein [Alteromonas gilva]